MWGFALIAMGALAACSVDHVKFSLGAEGMPDAAPDAPPDAAPREICSQPGDEDGNGMADCLDPACVAGMVTCAATATCNTDCSRSVCGDNKRNAAANEECDLGTTEDTAACDGDCTLPKCNDGRFNALAEEADPPASLSLTVPMNAQTCRYDFAAMTQLYCSGSCGGWGGGAGCQQEDADAFCKLKTGKATSVATSFVLSTAATVPGICCPSSPAPTGCKALGKLPLRGVMVDVSIDDTSLRASHGGGTVITEVVCTNP